jgi:hypothetical protein
VSESFWHVYALSEACHGPGIPNLSSCRQWPRQAQKEFVFCEQNITNSWNRLKIWNENWPN